MVDLPAIMVVDYTPCLHLVNRLCQVFALYLLTQAAIWGRIVWSLPKTASNDDINKTRRGDETICFDLKDLW